jgi:hypothetical protein
MNSTTGVPGFAHSRFVIPPLWQPTTFFLRQRNKAGGGGFIFFLVPPDEGSSVIGKLRGAGAEAGPVHLTSKGVETWTVPSRL